MARPLRIEFAEAFYRDDKDRDNYLTVLAEVIQRYCWRCYAYCLMSNHYHLVIETPDGNLFKGMRQLNGVYTQHFNFRHRCVGHLFQGRYKAILVESDAYLKELTRYVVLNPVCAEMVRAAKDWPWSSYGQTVGLVDANSWFELDALLRLFADGRGQAVRSYRGFVARGKYQPSPWKELKNQIYLGSDTFIEESQCKMRIDQPIVDIPKIQKSRRSNRSHSMRTIPARSGQWRKRTVATITRWRKQPRTSV